MGTPLSKKHVPPIRFPLTSSRGKKRDGKMWHHPHINLSSTSLVGRSYYDCMDNMKVIAFLKFEHWDSNKCSVYHLTRWFYRYGQGGFKNPPEQFQWGDLEGVDRSRFWHDFFGEQEMPPPKMKECHLKRDHFKRKGLSSNYHFFQGIFVSFRGSTSLAVRAL